MKEVRTAILGGSFDPVHLGHLFLLHCAVSMTKYGRFLLVPAKVSNFKQNSRPKASDEDRLAMLELALEDYKDIYPVDRNVEIEISAIELDRGGVSYTSDTVRFLKENLYSDKSQLRIGLIMGDDHISGLCNWHDFEYLKGNVDFIICRRNASKNLWEDIPKGIHYTKLEPEEVAPQSSSFIREDLNGSWDFLSKRVKSYVKEKNLYI